MALHLPSFWNWGLGQLENGLLVSNAVVNWVITQRSPKKKEGHAPARQLSKLICARAICAVLGLLLRPACYFRMTPLPLVALKGNLPFMQHNPNNLKDPINMYH